MKPHEETWKQDDEPTPGYVVRDDGTIVARVHRAEYKRLVIAAPEMARALLDVLPLVTCCDGVTNTPCAHCRVEAVLQNAGVLP